MSSSLKQDKQSSEHLASKPAFVLFAGLLLGIALCLGYQQLLTGGDQIDIATLQAELNEQANSVGEMRDVVDTRLGHVATKVADLTARMQRIDALGEHLTYAAGLDDGEFDFSAPVPSGGPVSADSLIRASQGISLSDLESTLLELDRLMQDRQDQLYLLANEIQFVEQDKQSRITGKPVTSGWLSSRYGYRTDPFTGKRAWHNGVDYAGRHGSDIVAVAGGVVTKSTLQSGYGYLVEISHVDGYITRYAHNKKNLVELGEVVKKGQKIALMGSTGRSTGPHVHFEVLKNGKSYDPARYLRRASR